MDRSSRSSVTKRALSLGGRTCLVVDGDPESRLEIARALARIGGRARSTASAEHVLSTIASEKVDVLIWALDDVEASVELMRQVRALPDLVERAIPAIALVRPNQTPPSAVMHLLRLFDDIVEQPLPPAALAERVAALVVGPASRLRAGRAAGED